MSDENRKLIAGEWRYFSPVDLGWMSEAEHEEVEKWPKAQARCVGIEDGEITFELIDE